MLDALETHNCAQVDVPKRRPCDPDSFDAGPTEVRPAEVRPAELRVAEVRPDEVRPAEVRPAEVHLAEVRSVEVRFPEIWVYLGVLVPPLIPGFYPFLNNLDMFLIGHRRNLDA